MRKFFLSLLPKTIVFGLDCILINGNRKWYQNNRLCLSAVENHFSKTSVSESSLCRALQKFSALIKREHNFTLFIVQLFEWFPLSGFPRSIFGICCTSKFVFFFRAFSDVLWSSYTCTVERMLWRDLSKGCCSRWQLGLAEVVNVMKINFDCHQRPLPFSFTLYGMLRGGICDGISVSFTYINFLRRKVVLIE